MIDKRLIKNTLVNNSGSQRIFILALDGTPYSLLRRFFSNGFMPNLKQLTAGNNFRQMKSVLPTVSSVAWSSFMTGKSPLHHGIYGFIDRTPANMEVYVPTAEHLRCQLLWEYLSERNKRVFVMNVPVTYPPRKVNGVLISGFLCTDINKGTYPQRIGRELENAGYRIDVDTVKARDDLEGFIKDLLYTYDMRVQTLWKFYQQESWDLFIAHIMETDRLHHFLWEYVENGHAQYTEIFMDFYRQIDQLIGRIADTLPTNMELMILSDHGFTTLKKEVFINKWLYDQGFLKFIGPEVPDSLHHIHPDSLAYSLIPGRVYLNLKGREKTGGVSAGMEYESLRRDLRNAITGMVDNHTGVKLVKSVYTPEELYSKESKTLSESHFTMSDSNNPYYLAPDLIILPEEGYDFKGNLWRQQLTEKGPIVGTHTYDDAFMLVKDHNLINSSFSIVDAMPTILDLMRIPVPEDLDGESVLEG